MRLCRFLNTSSPLGRCSKILLASATWASPEFYLRWKVSVTKCGSSVFRLVPSAPRTGGSGTGLLHDAWRTPERGSDNANRANKGQDIEKRKDAGHSISLRDQIPDAWQTPAQHQFEKRRQVGQTTREELLLPGQVKATWPTVTAQDAENLGGPSQMERNSLPLNAMVAATWPTVKAEPSGPDYAQRTMDGSGGDDLVTAMASAWPTPRSESSTESTRPNKMGGMKIADGLTRGPMPSGCLARTEKFVVRLEILSAWLMAYPWSYLKFWERKGSRRRKTAKSTEVS